MKIYLVRHGDALPVDQDPHRPLSPKGREDVLKTAQFLARNKIRIERIFHSGKLRSTQTAEILSQHIGKHVAIEYLAGMQPDDTVGSIASYCNHWDNDLMLVGHLPFLGKLVAELILGNESRDFVSLNTASVICMERKGHFTWAINWLIEPNLL